MNTLVKVSVISYTNTKPFLYGLQEFPPIQNSLEITFDSPRDCARKLTENQVDIGIVPVVTLKAIPHYEILTDYCIGCDGPVNSVFVFSQVPIHLIQSIVLDPESRTSNLLTQILCRELWNIEPQFIDPQYIDPMDPLQIDHNTAQVLIGDRTFSARYQFTYRYDLGEEWKKLTGLPFVFAVWASNKPLDESFKSNFNKALQFGLDHRQEVLTEIKSNPLPVEPRFDYHDYLFTKLSFELNDSKREALHRFLDYVKAF